MEKKKFTCLRVKKETRKTELQELEEYFERKEIDLEGGISRLKAIIEKRKQEIAKEIAKGKKLIAAGNG